MGLNPEINHPWPDRQIVQSHGVFGRAVLRWEPTCHRSNQHLGNTNFRVIGQKKQTQHGLVFGHSQTCASVQGAMDGNVG